MNTTQLKFITNWLKGYVKTFSVDGVLSAPLKLKKQHSSRVAYNARLLAGNLKWSHQDINSAEALGWLHDVGRFSQFAEFGTFSDANSINHGQRGRDIISQNRILNGLEPANKETLLNGIEFHNSKTVPSHLAPRSHRFTELIRDADKLDIFKIVLNSIRLDGFKELPNMLPQINLKGPINDEIVREIMTHNSCSLKNVHSLSDFLLMQLSWIQDLNYHASLQQIIERNIIDEIEKHLPDKQSCRNIIRTIRLYVENEIAQPN